VAYNVWQYAQASGDVEFLHTKGAEMLLQIARFWADSANWDTDRERYRIRGVMGPDEYHDRYPEADRPGVDDNSYTNITAAWVLCRALELLAELPNPRRHELLEGMGLEPAETDRWEDVSRRLYVPWHQGVISQFDGYGDLQELDWDAYRARYGDIRRLDRVLEAEGDHVSRYQASKQADTLMLGYLFPARRLAALFARLGHRLDDEVWRATTDYYLARTSHGTTLSILVHGWGLVRAHREEGWQYCREALLSDVADVQGGTTPEGIHLGAMAGTLDLVQRGLTGLEADGDALRLAPVPLAQLPRFDLALRFRGHWGIHLRAQDGHLHIGVPPSAHRPVPVSVGDRRLHVPPGSAYALELDTSGGQP
jgi:trehalose/maltose hydrolase-like predicted phosphorylase